MFGLANGLLLVLALFVPTRSQITTTTTDTPTDVVLPNHQYGLAILIPGQALDLECILSSDADAPMTWSKKRLGEREEIELKPTETINITRRTLAFTAPTYDDVGDYYCKTNSSRTNRLEWSEILVRLEQQVADFGIETTHLDDSCQVSEGDRVEMYCGPVDSMIHVESFWRRSPTKNPFGLGSERIISFSKGGMLPTGRFSDVYSIDLGNLTNKLVITSAGPMDRQYYTCFVKNQITKALEKQVFLRVRSRSLLLWPLVGLLAEVFLFGLIIYLTTVKSALEIKTQTETDNYECITTLSFSKKKTKLDEKFQLAIA